VGIYWPKTRITSWLYLQYGGALRKNKRAILVGFSDTHAGNKLGLCNPNTVIEYENQMGKLIKYQPELTEVQQYLWKCITEDKKKVVDLADGDDIIIMHNGDLTQGKKYVAEWVSTRLSDQLDIAFYNMLPWLEIPNVKVVRFGKGTGSHEFGEGSSTILVDQRLRERFPKKDIRTVYHGVCDILGVTIDYAHHGPYPGSRNWLRGNEARYYLRSIMNDEIDAGHVPPHLVMRSHYHTPVKEYLWKKANGTEYESWLLITPSYCLISDYARQSARSPYRITNGLWAVEIINNHIHDIHCFARTTDIRTKEKIL